MSVLPERRRTFLHVLSIRYDNRSTCQGVADKKAKTQIRNKRALSPEERRSYLLYSIQRSYMYCTVLPVLKLIRPLMPA